MAPLVKLTKLYLYNTSVGGDVSGVAPLVKLTVLSLFNKRRRREPRGTLEAHGAPSTAPASEET